MISIMLEFPVAKFAYWTDSLCPPLVLYILMVFCLYV